MEVGKMIFLSKWVIYRFQPLIFQGVAIDFLFLSLPAMTFLQGVQGGSFCLAEERLPTSPKTKTKPWRKPAWNPGTGRKIRGIWRFGHHRSPDENVVFCGVVKEDILLQSSVKVAQVFSKNHPDLVTNFLHKKNGEFQQDWEKST